MVIKMIASLISTEFSKVKGNRTFLITAIGACLIPVMLGIIQLFFGGVSLESALESTRSFNITFFFIMFGVLIINYLFTVDVHTRTIKSIIPLPVSIGEYIIGKYLTFVIWMFLLSLISIVSCVVIVAVTGGGFSLNVIIEASKTFLIATLLLILVMTPFMFIISLVKNSSGTLLLGVLIAFFNVMGITMFKEAVYSPWAIPDPLSTGTLTFSNSTALIIVVATFVIGYLLTYWYLSNQDIPL